MGDALGWRCKFGILLDASDTIMQPEFEGMRPVGVTNHVARIDIDSGVAAEPSLQLVSGPKIETALARVMSVQPDHLIFADARSLNNAAATTELRERITSDYKIPCTTVAEALPAALTALGCRSTIAVVGISNQRIRDFFGQAGFNVVQTTGNNVVEQRPVAATEEDIRQLMLRVDKPDAEAIVLLNASCSVASLAAEAEHWLGKPVISANTAVYWHALRQKGIGDKVSGFGALLERF